MTLNLRLSFSVRRRRCCSQRRCTGAHAQSYPSADIHFVTGFPPGSGADVITRFFAEKLRPVAGRTILVENKVGASGAISIEYVARSKPDGYTILFNAGSATAASMHLMKSPPVDVLKAFQIAATINRQAFMLVVDAKSPYHSVPELTAAMKQKGEKASYATAAPSGIVMGEMYKAITGVKAVEVRYKDAVGSLNELMDGKLDYGMHDPVFSLAQAREGRLRILAHSSGNAAQRHPRRADHGGIGRARHGSHLVVGLACAGRNAGAGDRGAQRLDETGAGDGGDQAVPQPVRRRPVHQHAGRRPGAVHQG